MLASKRLYREKDPPGSGDGEENLSPKRLASPNRTASKNDSTHLILALGPRHLVWVFARSLAT